MIRLSQNNMRLVQQQRIIPIHLPRKTGLGPDKIVFSKDIMPDLQEGRMNRKTGRQFAQNAIDLLTFGMFKRKDFVVELDGLLRFNKRGPAGVAFSVKDTLHLAFVLRKNGHYSSAIEKRFLTVRHITGLGQL